MLIKRILNPAKKNEIFGNTFHLIFMGGEAVLYDSLWDAPIIYGPKAIVRNAITDDKKLAAHLPSTVKEITLFIYKIQSDGEIKKKGEPVKGSPENITVPNY